VRTLQSISLRREMLPPRGCEYTTIVARVEIHCVNADVFIALNVIRIISIVSLVLVFASNIETLVHDVVAVNEFIAAAKGSDPIANNTQVQDSDYILCVYLFDSLRLPCLPDIDHVQGKHSPQPACRRVLGRS
jgi:hypothetical protein